MCAAHFHCLLFYFSRSLSLSRARSFSADWRLTPLIYRNRQSAVATETETECSQQPNKSRWAPSFRFTINFKFIKSFSMPRNLWERRRNAVPRNFFFAASWKCIRCIVSFSLALSFLYLPFNWCVSFTVCELSDCIAATAFFVFASVKLKWKKCEH